MSKKKMALGRRARMPIRSRIGRGLRQPVQFFKRSKWTTAQIVATYQGAGTNSVTRFAIEPTLADVPNYSEFTALYDTYQIKGIKITLFPKFSQSEGASSPDKLNSNDLPQVMSVLDYDGINSSTYMPSDLAQYQNFKVTRGNKLHSRYFRPQLKIAVGASGLTTAYGVARNRWIDTSRTDVTYYGLYGLVDMSGGNTDTRVVYDVKVDYYLCFKNVK